MSDKLLQGASILRHEFALFFVCGNSTCGRWLGTLLMMHWNSKPVYIFFLAFLSAPEKNIKDTASGMKMVDKNYSLMAPVYYECPFR